MMVSLRSLAGALLLVMLPAWSWACGLCADEAMAWHVPNYYWLLLVLLAWYLPHSGYRAVARAKSGKVAALLRHYAMVLVLGVVLFMIPMGSSVLIALVLFITFIVCTFNETKGGAKYRLGARPLTMMALVLMLGLTGWGYAQRIGKDDLDRALDSIVLEGAIIRIQSYKIANDPAFNVERLRPLINSDDEGHQVWAFAILSQRKNPEDLARFQEEVGALPQELFERDKDWQDWRAIRLQSWLRGIDAEHLIVREVGG